MSAATADFSGAEAVSSSLRTTLDRMSDAADAASARAAATAMANLAEGVQSLVQHMRSEQQLIRSWVDQQADQNRDIKKALERLASEKEQP